RGAVRGMGRAAARDPAPGHPRRLGARHRRPRRPPLPLVMTATLLGAGVADSAALVAVPLRDGWTRPGTTRAVSRTCSPERRRPSARDTHGGDEVGDARAARGRAEPEAGRRVDRVDRAEVRA